jgi:hypothetical protein
MTVNRTSNISKEVFILAISALMARGNESSKFTSNCSRVLYDDILAFCRIHVSANSETGPFISRIAISVKGSWNHVTGVNVV